jgi:hypothetical protein
MTKRITDEMVQKAVNVLSEHEKAGTPLPEAVRDVLEIPLAEQPEVSLTEPRCKGHTHDWFMLGTEDNGEKVDRCGNCLTLRYRGPDGKTRYEVPL